MNQAATEEEREFRELQCRDPVFARIKQIMAEALAKPSTEPESHSLIQTPDFIKRRSVEFRREKARCERKSIDESRRTPWALTHGVPIGWVRLTAPKEVYGPPNLSYGVDRSAPLPHKMQKAAC